MTTDSHDANEAGDLAAIDHIEICEYFTSIRAVQCLSVLESLGVDDLRSLVVSFRRLRAADVVDDDANWCTGELAFARLRRIRPLGVTRPAKQVVLVAQSGPDSACRGSPDIVGKTGLLDGKISSTSAIAVTPIEALVLSQHDFEVLVHKYPDFALRMLAHFSEKMHNYAMFLEDLLTTDLHHRTWQMLHYIASYFPNKEINLSQEELTDLLWGTRARVTEVLHDLEKEGKIQVHHRKIKVL